MEYRLKIGEEIIPIEVSAEKDQSIDISMDSEVIPINYTVISKNEIHLDFNGRATVAYVTDCSKGKSIMINGISYLVQDADTIRHEMRKTESNDIHDEVTPPMPSVVVRFMVKAGDLVEKGQCLVVVSAMKMETPINAPFSGKVISLNAAVGEKVMPGQILVSIKRKEGQPNE